MREQRAIPLVVLAAIISLVVSCTRTTDAGITGTIKTTVVKGLQIDVDTRDGVVFLTGSVASDAERNQAIQLARTTEGVKDVESNLR